MQSPGRAARCFAFVLVCKLEDGARLLRPGYTSDLYRRLIQSAERAPAKITAVLLVPTATEFRAQLIGEHLVESLSRWHWRRQWFRVEPSDGELLAAWLVSTLEVIQRPGEPRLAWQTHRACDLLSERSARAWQPLRAPLSHPVAA